MPFHSCSKIIGQRKYHIFAYFTISINFIHFIYLVFFVELFSGHIYPDLKISNVYMNLLSNNMLSCFATANKVLLEFLVFFGVFWKHQNHRKFNKLAKYVRRFSDCVIAVKLIFLATCARRSEEATVIGNHSKHPQN